MLGTVALLRALLLVVCMLSPFAHACSIGDWTSSTGLSSANVGEPAAGFKRYSGRCGLRVSASTVGFVTDPTPSAESALRIRFYVYTGVTAGAQVVLRAHPGDLPSSGSVFDVSYDANNQRFTFLVNGNTTSTPNGSAPRNRWIAVQLSYNASGGFSATTVHRGSSSTVNLATGATTVSAVSLGVVASAGGGTGLMSFDEYDSRRTTNPGLLCRGDANATGSLSPADAGVIQNERHSGALAFGQPDCTEDGITNVLDMVCVFRRISNGESCSSLGRILGGFDVIFSSGFE